MLVIVGASLVFATVIVNESVTVVVPVAYCYDDAVVADVGVERGSGQNTGGSIEIGQLGTVVPVIVGVSPTSTSDAVTV